MIEQDQTQEIILPARIVSQIEERISRTNFNDVDEYVTFVMREVLYEVAEKANEADAETISDDQVKDRLKSLGYLDG